jgi:hypothetical protein
MILMKGIYLFSFILGAASVHGNAKALPEVERDLGSWHRTGRNPKGRQRVATSPPDPEVTIDSAYMDPDMSHYRGIDMATPAMGTMDLPDPAEDDGVDSEIYETGVTAEVAPGAIRKGKGGKKGAYPEADYEYVPGHMDNNENAPGYKSKGSQKYNDYEYISGKSGKGKGKNADHPVYKDSKKGSKKGKGGKRNSSKGVKKGGIDYPTTAPRKFIAVYLATLLFVLNNIISHLDCRLQSTHPCTSWQRRRQHM